LTLVGIIIAFVAHRIVIVKQNLKSKHEA